MKALCSPFSLVLISFLEAMASCLYILCSRLDQSLGHSLPLFLFAGELLTQAVEFSGGSVAVN